MISYLKSLKSCVDDEILEASIDRVLESGFFPWHQKARKYADFIAGFDGLCSTNGVVEIERNYVARDLIFANAGSFAGKSADRYLDLEAQEADNPPPGVGVLFLGSHDFFQLATPAFLASYFGRVSAFAADPSLIQEEAIAQMTKAAYLDYEAQFKGGAWMYVGGDSQALRSHMRTVFTSRESVYAAIDVFPPQLKTENVVNIQGRFGHHRLISGAVRHAFANDYRFVFVKVRRQEAGLVLKTRILSGYSVEDILSDYIRKLEEELSQDPFGWEGIFNLM